jgi:hypothetical protein
MFDKNAWVDAHGEVFAQVLETAEPPSAATHN